jgi:hypothetical protein
MTDFSPFSAKRYEHAGRHVYFIPPDAFRLLELPVPTFLVGTRGTGKTTLLRALSWDERLYNSTLQGQIRAPSFEQKYIGLYFKLPNVQLELIDRWLRDEDDAEYAKLFAFYLDLCWLETAGVAFKHLVAQRIIRVSNEAEAHFVESFAELWRSHGSLEALIGDVGTSIDDVLNLMHPLRRLVERFARQRQPLEEVLDLLPVGQIGSFGRQIGRGLAEAIDDATAHAQTGWTFRICMDEGEVLTLRQQRVINSMVRLTEWPVFYLVAYVSRPQDATGTYLPNQTLQHADRQILVRDDMTDMQFKQLAEGVVNVRLKAMSATRRGLNTTRVLGRLSIDQLLEQILRESEDPAARSLLNAARRQDKDAAVPPIYATYLSMRRPELGAPSRTDRFESRRYSSASVRKQMVAAYLSICREVGAKPMYASADMVFQISDKCVRDYLWQMESIFALFGRSIEDFVAASINADTQDRALTQAADLKMTLFRERVISAPAEANQLVDGLARVTAQIQSTGRNFEQIRTPERGIFTYRISGGSDGRFPRLIRDAAEAGFLRLLDDSDTDELRFRVHASLAPRYGFSYRGAYYSAGVLTDADLLALGSATTSSAMNHAVDAIANRITGRRAKRENDDQLRFDDAEEEPS